MSSVTEIRAWSRQRWYAAVALVLAGQLGIIFWLGEKQPPRARAPGRRVELRLASKPSTELLSLEDPTLFALPHREGFSGHAWMDVPTIAARSFEWSEQPRWLSLATQSLGSVFDRFVETNRFLSLQAPPMPEREVAPPMSLLSETAPGQSSLVIGGSLADRTLLTKVDLPAWTNADLLTNSIVQVEVDPQGTTRSAVLLSSSGYPQADDFALNQARGFRFSPLKTSPTRSPSSLLRAMDWGQLIFEWQTLAPGRQ